MIKFQYDSDFDNDAPYYVIGNSDHMLVIVNPACTDRLDPWVREALINELVRRACQPSPPSNVLHLDEARKQRNGVACGPGSSSRQVATDR